MSFGRLLLSDESPRRRDPAADTGDVPWRTTARRVLPPFLVTRAFIILIAYLSTRVLLPGPWFPDDDSLLNLLIRWDAN